MESYETLLAKAKSSPQSADFNALRRAYTASPHFNPYMNTLRSTHELRQALATRNPRQILAAAQSILEVDYMDVEAHLVAANAHRQLGDNQQAARHELFAEGLIKAILEVDGRTPDTAFSPLSIREEYVVMGMLGLRVQGQRKAYFNGKNYDILTTSHPRTGRTIDFYFNIELMRQRMDRSSQHSAVS